MQTRFHQNKPFYIRIGMK